MEPILYYRLTYKYSPEDDKEGRIRNMLEAKKVLDTVALYVANEFFSFPETLVFKLEYGMETCELSYIPFNKKLTS